MNLSEKIVLNSKSIGDAGITLIVSKRNKNILEIFLGDEKVSRGSLIWEYQGNCLFLRRSGEKEIKGSIAVEHETATLFLKK